jgi:hypothetical protein
MEHMMKISKSGASAIIALIAAAVLPTDGAHARDLRTTAPMLGPSLSVLNSVTTTTTQPVVSKPAAAGTAAAASKLAAPIIEVRDHGLGGNADPCLRQHHCDQGSELKSLIAYYQNSPPTASFCAKGSPTGPCFQGFAYPDGTGHTKIFYIAFSSLGGNPLPGQMDKFLNAMKNAEANYKGLTYKNPQVVTYKSPQGVDEPGTRANGQSRDHRH